VGNHVLGAVCERRRERGPVSRMDWSHDTLRFSIPSHGIGSERSSARGDARRRPLSGAVIMPDGTRLPLTGMRALRLHGTRVVQWHAR